MATQTFSQRLRHLIEPALGILGVLLLWEGVSRLAANATLVPPPAIVWQAFLLMLDDNLPGAIEVGGQDVEKRAFAQGLKDEAAAVLLDFDGVIDARGGEQILELEGFAQFFGDENEVEFLIAEEFRLLFHA